jgi:hypothetical protein
VIPKLQEVDRAFVSLATQYLDRKLSSEQLVRTWAYVSAPRFDFGLKYFDRHGWASGRTVKQAPDTENQGVAEGLDASGRLVVERRYNEIDFYETFVNWSEALVEVSSFDYAPAKKPLYLHWLEYKNGVPEMLYGAARYGLRVEKFHWAESKLRKVEVYHSPRKKDGAFEPPTLHHTDELSYLPDGRLQRIEVVWPETSQRAATRTLAFERRAYGIYRKA